jgi:polysaccharide export outer membrane protein
MRSKITSVGTLILLLGLTACHTEKNTISYFQDIEKQARYTNVNQNTLEQQIQVGNDLIIRVSNVDPSAVAAFNMPAFSFVNGNELNTQQSASVQTYLVDRDGNISFPVFGRINVVGKSCRELAADLESRIEAYASGSTVQVIIDGYQVSLLGEVNQPGMFQFIKDRTTLLDLISYGGDLTIYGDRTNVLLIRETPEGTVYKRFDLTKAETLSCPEFYLQQHDIVYVEPILTRRKTADFDTMKQYNLSFVSTVVSCVSVLASLLIALLVK